MEIKNIVISVGILRATLYDQDQYVTLPYAGASDQPIKSHDDIQKWDELTPEQLDAYVMPGSFGKINCLECGELHDSVDIIYQEDIADLKREDLYLFIG